MDLNRKKVAVPIGDPAGIGPEIVLRALNDRKIRNLMDIVVIGEAEVLRRHSEACGLNIEVQETFISVPSLPPVKLINVPVLKNHDWKFGEVSGITGKACYEYACTGIKLALEKKVSVVVAAPHTEASVNLAGLRFRGYPGLVAEKTGTPQESTFLMLLSPFYRVVNATLHLSLREAINLLDKKLILNALKSTKQALDDLGLPDGSIGVCSLNPHAGEGGLMGSEEADFIEQGVYEARKLGINANGPFPSDSLFGDRRYDAYLALYHDQGHIPVKVASPRLASAITIGTPVLFGSVAHGSALDIAGKGVASEKAFIQALNNLVSYSDLEAL